MDKDELIEIGILLLTVGMYIFCAIWITVIWLTILAVLYGSIGLVICMILDHFEIIDVTLINGAAIGFVLWVYRWSTSQK